MKNYIDPISLFKQTNFSNTIWWRLKVNISGYQHETENNLVTEIFKNRVFKLIHPNFYQNTKKVSRVLVQFYEDGYICWIDLDKLMIEKYEIKRNELKDNEGYLIKEKIPLILNWIKGQSELKNRYLWGGALGPNFDCSGLIQTAFFIHRIELKPSKVSWYFDSNLDKLV